MDTKNFPKNRIVLAIEMKYQGTEYAILVGERSSQYDEGELRELSKQFPNCVFELHGDGEESGDVWCAYFKDGKIRIGWRRFDKPKMVQNAEGEMVEHPFETVKIIPDDCEVYGSFEAYVDEWHGYKFDEEKQAYVIGRIKEMADAAYGERSLVATNGDPDGYLTDQPHEADIARVSDIDFEGMDLEVDGKIEEWWKEYEVYKKVQAGFNMPQTLQNLGVIRCVKA